MLSNSEKTMEKVVALCKGRGFVFPGSEIYGGLANTWDYGPLGVELKNNVKKAWWKKFVQENPYNVGLDAAILMNPQVWVASGHVGGFSDPLMDCKECHERFRADKVIEDWCQENHFDLGHSVDAMSQEEYRAAACAAVKKLSQDVGIPADLKEIVKEEDVQFLAESAYADACRPGNPRDTSVEEIAALYRSLM